MKKWNFLDWVPAIMIVFWIVVIVGFIIWIFSLPNDNNNSNNTYTPSVHLTPNGKGGFSTYVY